MTVDYGAHDLTTTGSLKIGTFTFPTSDGTNGQVLQTDGSGTVTWVSISGGSIDGSGTAGYIVKFSDSDTLTDSIISESSGTVTIAGNLTVSGTTTTINSTTLTVDDKNIELGDVALPTDITADGGGITLKGSTDKTIIWDNANDNWTSSEHWNLASGKEFKINNVVVLNATKSTNWDTAYGWGNHSTQGYLTSLGTAIVDADFTSNGLMKRSSSGVYTSITDNSTNWDTAYGWGNHSTQGYLTTSLSSPISTNQVLSYNGSNWTNKTFDISLIQKGSVPFGGYLSSQMGYYYSWSVGNEAVVNEQGNDIDFRVEGYTDSNLLLVDAGTDTVQIGKLNINGNFTFPTTDGSADQVLVTDGAGNVAWSGVSGGGGSTSLGTLSVTSSQSLFNMADSYSSGGLAVFLNGVKLVEGTDFSETSSTSFTLTSPAASGDIVEYVAYGSTIASTNLQKTGDTMTGNLTVNADLIVKGYKETHVDNGNTGTSQTIAITNSTLQTYTLNGNCTFTMPTADAGRSFTIFLKTGAGSFTATFTGVKWPAGSAPTITTTASRMDILTFYSDGTNWYGNIVQEYTP